MSEHQYVYFAAVDRPLDDQQMAFMRRQSSRATVTRWEFSNEYHFGDFHGKTEEMMRRGFDVHLHFANFGIRRLLFRLPTGLPWSPELFRQFEIPYGIEWIPDNQGRAGSLNFHPDADAGTYEDYDVDTEELTAALPRLRALLLRGDLRPLYLAWLAFADESRREPPVPAGLNDLPPELKALCAFYEVSRDLVAAAAEQSPPAPAGTDEAAEVQAWLDNQSPDQLRALLRRVLTENDTAVRAEVRNQIRAELDTPAWPTVNPTRTLAEIAQRAEKLRHKRREQEAAAAARARQQRLQTMAADPARTVAEARQLVARRSTTNYRKAAQMLAELREALGPERGPALTADAVNNLVHEYSRLNSFKSALRQEGLWPVK